MRRELTVTPTSLNLTALENEVLVRALEGFHAVTPCVQMTYTRQPPPSNFIYRIDAVDGRVWEQLIVFDVPENPSMTFVVPAGWRLSEFSPQRALRNMLVAMTGKYTALEQIKYEF